MAAERSQKNEMKNSAGKIAVENSTLHFHVLFISISDATTCLI
jgi:hypothetical protein